MATHKDQRHDQERRQRVVQDIGPPLCEAAIDQGTQAGAEREHGARALLSLMMVARVFRTVGVATEEQA